MKKAKDDKKKDRKRKILPGKEDGKLAKAKITAIPTYIPGELPKR